MADKHVPPLHKAAASGDADAIRQMVDKVSSIDTRNSDGAPALHLAITGGHLVSVNVLLSHGASISETDVDGDTALHRAVRKGDVVILERLMAAGSDATLETQNVYGFTALFLAVRVAQWNGHAVVEHLLKHGADPLAESHGGVSPSQEAMDAGQYDLVKLLDRFKGPHVVTPSPYEEFLLHGTDLWKNISAACARVFWAREKGLGSIKDYMNLTNNVHNALTSATILPESGAHCCGEVMYRNLITLIKAYVRDISMACTNLDDSDVVAFYFREWKRYTCSMKSIERCFRHLSRHWVTRERNEGKHIYDIHEMLIVIWKIYLVDADPRLQKKLNSSLVWSVNDIAWRMVKPAGPGKEIAGEALKELFVREGDLPKDFGPEMGLLPFLEQQKALWRAKAFDLKHKGQDDFVQGVLTSLGRAVGQDQEHDGDLAGYRYIVDSDALPSFRAAMVEALLTDNAWTVLSFTVEMGPRSGRRLSALLSMLSEMPDGKEILKKMVLKSAGGRDGLTKAIARVLGMFKEYEDEWRGGTVDKRSPDWHVQECDIGTQTGKQAELFLRTLKDIFDDDVEIKTQAGEALESAHQHVRNLLAASQKTLEQDKLDEKDLPDRTKHVESA